jgi:hypothetical protein
VYTLFSKSSSGAYTAYATRINAIAGGSVLVNEAMPLADTSATSGQWIELSNESDGDIDLSGTVLTSTTTSTSWTLPDGVVIPARGFLVVGQSVDPTLNGASGVELEWAGLNLDPVQGDEVVLSASGTPLSSLRWDAGAAAGISVQQQEKVIDTNGLTPACTRTSTFGGNGAIGTPGAVNEMCWDYRLAVIPVNYEDISAIGTPLFTGTSMYSLYKVITLAAPFPWFGNPQPVMTVTTNGYLIAGSQTSASTVNKAKPSTTAPVGTLAVFWDYLTNTTTAGSNVYTLRIPGVAGRPGYTIVEWNHFKSTSSATADDMNFEAKLFDDGVIEFHFGTMTSGTTANYAGGTSATTWLERPAGDTAMVIGANAATGGAYLSPNTAYRFMPRTLVHP